VNKNIEITCVQLHCEHDQRIWFLGSHR